MGQQQSWHGNITTRFSDDFYFQLVLDQEGTVENRIPTLFVQDLHCLLQKARMVDSAGSQDRYGCRLRWQDDAGNGS